MFPTMNRFSPAGMPMAGWRHGITPVVSMILLVLMGITLAGAFYTWQTDIQDGLMQSTQDEFSNQMLVKDVRCKLNDRANGGDDELELFLQNAGERDISGRNVDVYMYDANNELVISLNGLDWQGAGFTQAGDAGTVTEPISQSIMQTSFTPDGYYPKTMIQFSDPNIEVEAGGCLAE